MARLVESTATSTEVLAISRYEPQQHQPSMAILTNTLIVDGPFEELADEFATYLDGLSAAQGAETTLQADIQPLLQGGKREAVLKKLVTSSSILNNAPERGWSYGEKLSFRY